MKTSRLPYGIISLSLTGMLAMILVVPVDYMVTMYLREHRLVGLSRFMDRSMFELEGIGGGDPIILFLVVAVIAYYLSWKKGEASKLYAWRPQLGFIVTSTLTCSLIMVHSLKWVIGRARPSYVVKGVLPYTDWFAFGPHFISEGVYRGSFPSGHTAQAIAIFTLVYVFAGIGNRSGSPRLAGWAWGTLSFFYILVMGMSRCMTLSHWFSDVLGSFFLGWILMHLIYYRLLKVPEQSEYYDHHGCYPPQPVAWELVLSAFLFAAVLGGMSALLGVRGIRLDAHWGFILLFPLGIGILIFSGIRFKRYYRRVMAQLTSGHNETGGSR